MSWSTTPDTISVGSLTAALEKKKRVIEARMKAA
jgi:hypothetical protein